MRNKITAKINTFNLDDGKTIKRVIKEVRQCFGEKEPQICILLDSNNTRATELSIKVSDLLKLISEGIEWRTNRDKNE